MTVRNFSEVLRSGSQVEGGLSGPANPIPNQSIDCGCGQMQCPKLAKFATRKLYVVLICWIGVVQAASHAYFYVTGSTIARKFQIDPYVMDWVLVVAELTPFILGLAVAYWGDKIHRASWTGALILLQSVSYFILIIPHLTHRAHVIDETLNMTNMSLYADDNPELCSTRKLSKIMMKEDDTCYLTMVVMIIVLVISGIANVAYYALGISYLDDNTKRKHVTAFIGLIIAVKIFGMLFGFFLGWGCLRIDAENFSIINSYQNQIGAWWLGFPILSILLVVPGLLLSWFPRRLPSEVVEQAAASLLDLTATSYNRAPHRETNLKVGSPDFWPSLCRLITNQVLMCNILATVFCATALVNFITYEDIFLQSRFHMPKPTGMLLGFSDPLLSRLTTNIMKPILIGLIIIISGLVLSKGKPRPRFIVGYSFIVVFLSLMIIISLLFITCDKPPIVGINKNFNELIKHCNKDCNCTNDFRPICESSGKFTYYNPCYAGCTTIIFVDDVKIYSDCSCIEDITSWDNDQAKDGACDSYKCQAGWILFEFMTLIAYALVASTFVGDFLINIRSVYKQDKAISIGFWMMWLALAYGPGKILYEVISCQTCQYWSSQKAICHLHNGQKFGDYLCYLTSLFLLLYLLLKILVYFLCKNLQLYEEVENKGTNDIVIQEIGQTATAELEELMPVDNSNNNTERPVEAVIESEESRTPPTTTAVEENSRREEESTQKSVPLKYSPLGPGDRRTSPHPPAKSNSQSIIQNPDSEDELDSSSDESRRRSSPQVAYSPLELDSDVESDLSSAAPRSRKRVPSKDYDQTDDKDDRLSSKDSSIKRHFPNPDHYEDPQRARNYRLKNVSFQDGSLKTSSFEFSKTGQESGAPKRGDFNEVGIPIVDPFPDGKSGTSTAHLKDVKSLIDRYEQNASQETLEEDQLLVKSTEDTRNRSESKMGIPLVAMVPGRSSLRGQSASGINSLPDVHDKNANLRSERHTTPSPKSIKENKPSHQTDL